MIRPYEERDRPNVERLMDWFGDELAAMDPYRRVLRGEGFGAYYVDRMLTEAREHDGLVLVAEEDGSVVGFAGGAVRDRPDEEALEVLRYHDGEITELYVAPTARRRGIGAALVERLEDEFRARGCGAVHIDVFAPNESAKQFYAWLGYVAREIHQLKILDRET